MAEILILSDTHSHYDLPMQKHIETADEVWHAGDIGNMTVCKNIQQIKPLRAVHGNIDDADTRKEFPEDLIFNFEGIKVFITHIGGYPGRYNARAKKIIQQERPALFICGHSHILKVMPDPDLDLLHINPGAIGKHGFHVVRTMVKLKIENGKMSDLRVIELGKRAELG